MTTPVDRSTWLEAQAAIRSAEKQHTRAGDELAKQRRALPHLRIDEGYSFDTTAGQKGLADLLAGRRQLVVYHFMFGTDWDEGCPICSYWADSFDGIASHLAARDTTFLCSSNAALDKLQAYRERMGWSFEWVSSAPSEFTADMGFSTNGHRPDALATATDESPGMSIFELDGDEVHLTYQTTARGLEAFNAAYNILDFTPLGRNEDDLPFTMAWVQRHDMYDHR